MTSKDSIGGEGGYTALHEAATKGQTDIVKLLLTKILSEAINSTTDTGKTASDPAKQQRFKEIVMLTQMKTQEELKLVSEVLTTPLLDLTIEDNPTDTTNDLLHQIDIVGNILQNSDFL